MGSSGSSAGPASATAAGLVGFAIGSETAAQSCQPALAVRSEPACARRSAGSAATGPWPELDDGQARPALPDRPRTAPRPQGDPRPGRQRTITSLRRPLIGMRRATRPSSGPASSRLTSRGTSPMIRRRPNAFSGCARRGKNGRRGPGCHQIPGRQAHPIEMPKLDTAPIGLRPDRRSGRPPSTTSWSATEFDSMTAEPERSSWVGSMRQHELRSGRRIYPGQPPRLASWFPLPRSRGIDLFYRQPVWDLTPISSGHSVATSLFGASIAQGQAPESLRCRPLGEETPSSGP